MKRLNKYSQWAWLILAAWCSLSFATIKVQIQPKSVQLGETFQMILTIENSLKEIPDLSALQKHFYIRGTQRNVSYRFINGQAESSNQWIILLQPKQKGKLTIPSIHIGNEATKSTFIKVTEQQMPVNTNDLQEEYNHERTFLKTSISPKKPYINQQITYTVKLYRNVRLIDAEYQPPTVKDALLISLGDATSYQTHVDGKDYVVEQLRYAIFPQKSGSLTITGPAFSALVFDVVPDRVTIQPKTQTIAVKPALTSFSKYQWLPSGRVILSESYDSLANEMNEGDTVTRTVTLKATGVPGQLLPALSFNGNDDMSVYSAKPEIKNTIQREELIGETTVNVTYILNKSGMMTIPRLIVPWYNTKEDKEEIASLPARTINVKPKTTVSSPGNQTTIPVAQSLPITAESAPNKQNQMPLYKDVKFNLLLAWWLVIALACAWIVTLCLWWFSRKTLSKRKQIRLVLKQLHNACKSQDPSMARDALMAWGALQWPDKKLFNLNDLTKHIHNLALKKEIHLLSKVLYSPNKKIMSWQGKQLWQVMMIYLKTKPVKRSNRHDLPPMNPN